MPLMCNQNSRRVSVDAGSRFVEEQDIRFVHQRAGQRRALFEAERQRVRRLIEDRREVEGARHLVDFVALRLAAQAVDAGEELQVLRHRQVAVQREFCAM